MNDSGPHAHEAGGRGTPSPATGPVGGPREGVRVTLRMRVLTLVAAVNVAVFGAGLFFLTEQLAAGEREREREFAEQLASLIRPTTDRFGDLRVGQILRWPYWDSFRDAIIVSRRAVEPGGRVVPEGAFINPLGSLRRDPAFDMASILDRSAEAIASDTIVSAPRGTVFPIHDPRGEVWGACWFEIDPSVDTLELFQGLLPWFLVSTLLLILATFWLLRRQVLEPLEALALGARRVSAGDLSVRLPVPRRRDEISDLMQVFNDMTGQVRGFRAHLQDEVEKATDQARRAEAAAMRQRRLASMGELAAGIAHEINNPLGGLLNAVKTLERPDLPEQKRRRYHELLAGGLERIQGTVTKLLRFTPRGAEQERFDLADPARDALSLVEHRVEKLGARVDARLDRPSPQVLGSRSELGQAVLNLLANALDALEELPYGEGRIRLELEARGSEVALVCVDNGPGVEESELERIGDLFYTTKEVGRGTGLGLALVHSVVAQHGGRVLLSSGKGAGFVVELLLPAADGGRA